MSNDIRLKLSFDYSKDTKFVVPPASPTLQEFNVSQTPTRTILNGWGFFSAWGKELEGCNQASPGGAGLEGAWIFMNRDIQWTTHPEDPAAQVVSEINLLGQPPNDTPNSPIVVAFTLETVRYIVMLHKDNAVALETTENLVGTAKTSKVTVKGTQIPYPAHANWKAVPGFSKGAMVPSAAHNSADMLVELEVGSDLTIGVAIIDFKALGGFNNEVLLPLPLDQSLIFDDGTLADMQASTSAFGAMVKWGAQASNLDLVRFDPQPVKQRRKYPGSGIEIGTDDPAVPLFDTSKPVIFEAPEGLDLPDPPEQYRFALNLRGILFLEEIGVEGVPLWPYEVFDLCEFDKDIEKWEKGALKAGTTSRQLDYLRTQRQQIVDMFKYMEEVGYGIATSSKAFGEE